MAVALWLVAARNQYKKLSVAVPAGLGKTRILLGLACLLKNFGFKTIKVAYPNELLLNQERHNLVKVQSFLGEDCF